MTDFELVSPHRPDVCAARLLSAIDGGPLRWLGSRPVVGRVRGRSVRLRKRLHMGRQSNVVLAGTLEGSGGGTVFRGRVRFDLFSRAVLVAVVGLLSLAWVAALTASVRAVLAGREASPAAVLVPPAMLAAVALVALVNRHQARGEDEFLLAFAAGVIDARAVAQE